ncbi:zinc finger protein 407 isoform X2 [Rhineura floridana]|uniref:zinc finger protein 407 isoform X2 n=1 Tax=Rhineura floridana TaxID=261503 RepID=UPI002AC8906D|nr:zinc finger protein 407 isoform X2 [Rhineura floridana]
MDVEKNQKNDEGDENVQNELEQEAAKNVSAEKAHSESFSTSKTDTFSTEGQKNPGEKTAESAITKRPLSKSADEDCVVTNILESEPVSKRLKLTVVKHEEENEGKPSNATTREDSVDGASNTTVETVNEVAMSASPSSDAFISNALCVPHDFKSEDDTTQEIHVANEHSQDVPALLPECTSSFQPDEASVSCATSCAENVSKCKICEEIFFTYSDLEKHVQENHPKHSKEQVNPHCTYKWKYTPSLQTHMKQAAGQLRLYFCDLCGFQSFEKDLLQTHFLGKTHLRRQNLAARGGFVKTLMKKSFHKKQQYPVREKNVRTKSALNKPKIRNTDSNLLRTSSNKMKLKTCHQLFVEMVPSRNISTENNINEEVLFSSTDGNGDVQVEKPDVSESSECNPDVLEPAEGSQEIISNLNIEGTFDRFPHKRNILSRRITFKQSGSFRLNQQIKKRYNLLGLGKRNKPDSSLKHNIRPDFSQGDSSQVPLNALETENDVNHLCKADPESQSLNPDGANACSSVTLELENSPKKAVDIQTTLHPCTHYGCMLPNTGLELPVDRDHAEELKCHCQTCGYSCATQEDFELHCQKNSHHMGDCKINCLQCSFFAPNDVSLGKHMHDEHGMSHCCVTCHLYFLSEEEVTVHNTTEQHIALLAQENTVQPLNSVFSLQTASCVAMETSVLPKVVEAKIQQEIPKPSAVHAGNEVKESVLSRTQFQCKKCFYKTRSSSVLTRHIKLRHGQEYHFLCKACNLYSLSKEGMEKHIKRSKHLENARKNNIGLCFEECIERVCVGDGKKVTEPSAYGSLKTLSENENMQAPFCSLENVSINKELFPSGEIIKGNELVLGSGQKRGRPKGTISRTCPHCGLLASSVTNLTVHIRRKHSHQYSYLCKVCNYYTVTKGDMERHCATKKHKGRLEANGKQNVEIIVCPEKGNVETSSKKINNPEGILNELVDHGSQCSYLDNAILESQGKDQGNAIHVQGENAVQLSELDRDRNSSEIRQHIIAELGNANQDGETLVQTRSVSANGNKCAHCNFVAHSFSSLEVHIKRKHTKEFEYYCMACDYYAVTRREMIRHAATEKHKIKRQSYICPSSGGETDVTDIAKEQQSTDEFQIMLDGTKKQTNIEEKSLDAQVTQKVKKSLNYLASEDAATSKVPEEDYVINTVDAETEDGVDQGRENAVGEENIQEGVVKLGEMATLKETIDCVLQENVEDQEMVKSNFNFATEIGNKNRAVGKDSANLNLMRNKNKLGEDHKREIENIEVPAEEIKREEMHLPMLSETGCTLEQQTIDENIERTIKTMHNLQGQKSIQQSSATEEEGTLTDEENEVEVSLNNIWGSDASVVEGMQESNEASDAFTSVEGRVKEMSLQNCQFDSSIVKLKSHEDGSEPIDHVADGQNLSGLRALKVDAPQGGGKKKKAEGHPLGESTRIRCDDCGFLADGLSGLNVHIAMKHPSKEKHFHCLLCGKSFYTESNLHQHLASAGHMRNEQASVEELPEGGATFKCVKCTEPFDSEQNLFLHIKEQHEELLREVNKYIVEDTEQINREREENKGNICKYCGKICRSSNSMAFLAHIRTHTGSKPFKCKICHFATAQLGDARNHVKRHLGMREYKCHVCGVAFVMKKHLNTHLLGKHRVGTPKERKFTCPLCDRSFTEKWAMNNHMKLHTGEKPYKCSWPTCHYSFLTASAMKDHYRTHTGEKSFLCDLCGFAGGTRHALTKHRRQHTGEKPFKCDECNFASTTQSHLTRHKRVHTGEKPYRCPWCDYRSNCAENIRKHILHTGKHEGVKMYNCPKCEYGTNIPVEFRNHLKELHADIENPDLAYLHAEDN